MLDFYKRKLSPRAIILPVVIVMVHLFAPYSHADWCSPLQVSLWPPIQLVSEESSVCGLRLDLGWGENRNVAGLDLGIANGAESIKGIEIGVFNRVHAADQSDSWGFQLAVLNDTDNTRYTGVQLGLVFNSNTGDVNGLQIAIGNTARDMDGIQISLGNSANNVDGAQLSVVNSARDVHGVQLAAFNIANNVRGVQIAVVNSSGDLHGVQIGALNQCVKLTGVQIGVINKCVALAGVQIGVVNIVDSRPTLGSGRIIPIVNVGF